VWSLANKKSLYFSHLIHVFPSRQLDKFLVFTEINFLYCDLWYCCYYIFKFLLCHFEFSVYFHYHDMNINKLTHLLSTYIIKYINLWSKKYCMWGGQEMRNIFTAFNSWRQLWWWIALGIEACTMLFICVWWELLHRWEQENLWCFL